MRALLFAALAWVGAQGSAPAGQPPPPPAPAPAVAPPPAASSTAWACTKDTLRADLPCTVEGASAAQAASKDQAKENARQAKAVADELCADAARGESTEPDAGVLKVCLARAPSAVKRCGGDGQRALLDDGGRFNPGHARCYAAIAQLLRDVRELAELSSSCCDCVHDSCNGSADQCIARIADGKTPDAACVHGLCATACAQLTLAGRVKP